MSSPSHILPRNNLFRPAQPTPLQRFLRNPLFSLATYLYTHQPTLKHPLRIICLSDTHNTTPPSPPGDILLHAGDLTQNGTFAEIQATPAWLSALPHPHKFVIAGNHDLVLSRAFVAAAPPRVFTTAPGTTKDDLDWGEVIYLENASASVTVRGRKVKVWGAPWTPKYGNWAFQYPPGEDIWQGKIPEDADILVTHGPARGHLDVNGTGNAGCMHMRHELERVKPRLVVGVLVWMWSWVRWAFGVRREATTTLVNASTVGHGGVAEGMAVEI
ncbi:Metallo-dependent phosphatase [Karstenula rhodostoma CBS 690.94]|uniref:Metallo-dependent phosphatase n=1 Tax=Karstenula rhodostoma CBS 690.94 TaxID=1392251 RepID=A0A9P4P6X7_9PLEO|nr:Metallo-dependent phosphatase [Karstenula rhodostoma CBS 690.94]